MEFRLSKEHEMFKRSVREYCEKNVAPRSREIDEKENGIPMILSKVWPISASSAALFPRNTAAAQCREKKHSMP